MSKFLHILWKTFIVLAFIVLATFVLFKTHAQAAEKTLFGCYEEKGLIWGSVEERAGTAKSFGIENYRGTLEQNRVFAAALCDWEPSQVLGAGYAPVTGFSTQTTSRVSASASTIPVASVTDKAGNVISTSNISSSSTVRMYFNFEPGTPREEPFYCTGISSLNLTGCVRGISFQGSDLTSSSTIAQIHNAGANVIMTNTGAFYGNEFVATNGGAQDVSTPLTFNTYPKYSATTTVPTLGAQFATKYYVDNVGAGGFTCSNVSSTLGLQCTGSVPETVGMKASSTGGIAFDSSGYAYVNASTTASTNGGFLKYTFDSANKLFWDIVSFLAGSYTWSGNHIYSGTVTSTGTLRVSAAPSSVLDATNKQYVDLRVASNSATGTTALAITAGQALYNSTTSTLAQTNTDVTTSTFQFIGIAETTASSASEVRYTKPGGINCNQSGLTAGSQYYLNGTNGQISTTPGTQTARIGIALNTTCIQLLNPYFRSKGTISLSGATTGSTSRQFLGFYPAKMRFRSGTTLSSAIISLGDENTSYSTNASAAWSSSAFSYVFDDGANSWTGSTSRDATGFTMTHTRGAGAGNLTATIQWEAESQ